jgi:hypothetical protein
MELCALDSANLDKYWLCNHCLPTTQIHTPERNLPDDDLIEALEYLRAWCNNSLTKRPYNEGNVYTTSVSLQANLLISTPSQAIS